MLHMLRPLEVPSSFEIGKVLGFRIRNLARVPTPTDLVVGSMGFDLRAVCLEEL
jgi:hypothetical protein